MKRVFLKTLLAGAAATLLVGVVPLVHAQDKGLVAISMPTKSSARWIADGDNMVKVLARRRATRPTCSTPRTTSRTSSRRSRTWSPRAPKVLVIAAIDGTTLSDVLQKAADKGVKVIAYDRLIKGSKNVDYYATFDNFQVGVLQAAVHRRRALEAEGAARARSTSSCSAARPTTTTPSSSTTARCRCSSPTSTAASWWCAASRWAWTRSRRCAGTAPWRRRAWTTCCRPTTPGRARRRGAVAVRRPVDRHPVLAQGRGLRHGAAADAGRHRPGRGNAVGQVDPTQASRPPPCSRTRASSPRSRSAWSTRCSRGKQPEVNDTKTYNNGVKVVPSYLLKPVQRGCVELEADR